MADPMRNEEYWDSAVLDRLAAVTQNLKDRTVELLQIKSGDCVLDVGCGPGIDTIPIARIVGEDGLVVGIDYDELLIKEAVKRAKDAKVASWVRHTTADASSLPQASNFFDVCRCERLFQHVANGRIVLREMVRVTKSGGRIAVADTDWCSLSIDTPEIGIERRVVRAIADMVRNGYAGRQLYRLFKEQKLADILVELHPIVWTDYEAFRATSFSLRSLEDRLVESSVVTDGELHRFLSSLEEAHRRGVFFASGIVVLAVGTKQS